MRIGLATGRGLMKRKKKLTSPIQTLKGRLRPGMSGFFGKRHCISIRILVAVCGCDLLVNRRPYLQQMLAELGCAVAYIHLPLRALSTGG
jgi:hypothetical protein